MTNIAYNKEKHLREISDMNNIDINKKTPEENFADAVQYIKSKRKDNFKLSKVKIKRNNMIDSVADLETVREYFYDRIKNKFEGERVIRPINIKNDDIEYVKRFLRDQIAKYWEHYVRIMKGYEGAGEEKYKDGDNMETTKDVHAPLQRVSTSSKEFYDKCKTTKQR